MAVIKSPCFQFYPSDFFGDIKVRIMTAEEKAFYLLLLANIWEYDTQYSIPDDELLISNILQIDHQRTCRIMKTLRQCFLTCKGRLISRRLKKEKEKHVKYIKSQSEKGKKSVQARFNRGSTVVQPEGNPPKPIPKPKHKEHIKAIFSLPDWIKKTTWDAYREMRQRKRAPLTDQAAILIVKKLEDLRRNGNDPDAVLSQSIMNSWTGVFPVKVENIKPVKEYQPEIMPEISDEDKKRNLAKIREFTDKIG